MMVCSLSPTTDSTLEDAIRRPHTLGGGRTYPTTLVAKHLCSRRTRNEVMCYLLFFWFPCDSTWGITVSHLVITLDHFINWWLPNPFQFQMPDPLLSVVFSWAFLWAWLGTRVGTTNWIQSCHPIRFLCVDWFSSTGVTKAWMLATGKT